MTYPEVDDAWETLSFGRLVPRIPAKALRRCKDQLGEMRPVEFPGGHEECDCEGRTVANETKQNAPSPAGALGPIFLSINLCPPWGAEPHIGLLKRVTWMGCDDSMRLPYGMLKDSTHQILLHRYASHSASGKTPPMQSNRTP